MVENSAKQFHTPYYTPFLLDYKPGNGRGIMSRMLCFSLERGAFGGIVKWIVTISCDS